LSNVSSNRPFPVLQDAVDSSSPESAQALAVSKAASEELSRMKNICLEGGGPKGIERHVVKNKKMLARDRIRRILDPGSELWELGMTAGLGLEYGDVPTAGTVAGVGKVHGIDCLISASDGTVKGGALYPITVTKGLRMQDIARRNRLPCLQVVDTGGAFLPLQSDLFVRGGRSFGNQALMSAEGIQQVALVSGMCTAGGAYQPTMSDIAIITHRIGNIYLGGPPLVKAATGEVVTGEELGGATLHCSVSGITDHFAGDEAESFTIARDVMASLNLSSTPDILTSEDAPLYSEEGLDIVAGSPVIDKAGVMGILSRITDASRFFEFKTMFGGNLVCGFGHLGGQMTGFLANSGPITAGDAQKGGHFVQLCDNRDIPLVFLQNSSMSGDTGCDAATMKERAKMIQCLSVVRVPRISLNVGGVLGDENYTMCGPAFEPNFYFMWPRTSMLMASPEVADPAQVPSDAQKKPRKKLSAFDFVPGSSGWAGGRMMCDGVIEPRETRAWLTRAVQIGMSHHVALRDDRGPQRSVVRM